MNDAILPISPGLMALLSKEHHAIKPFQQEIFLLEIIVAGTSFCKEASSVADQMLPEKVLTMKREPNNSYDAFAIAIYCDAVRIGYVPADLNQVCSRLMDAGKFFFCRVVASEWKNKWLKINANIYMVE